MSGHLWAICALAILLLMAGVPPLAAGILIGATWGAGIAWRAHGRVDGRRVRRAL